MSTPDPFSVKAALAAGVEPSRLRRRDLVVPYRGARAAASPLTLVEQCRAYRPVMHPSSWFSHETAAALLGLWLPAVISPDIHVTTPLPHRAPRMRGVHGHKAVAPVEVVEHLGLPVASPVDTWRGLALHLTPDQLVVAGDSMVRRDAPLTTIDELRRAVIRGHRGAQRLKAALAMVRADSASARETKLRMLLVRAGLPEPELNVLVLEYPKRRFGDLVFARWRVIVEYDGRHHLTPEQRAADIVRHEELVAAGWLVVVVVAEHLAEPHRIVARVAAALRSRGWRG
ncbi:MAG TPA: DUF559 domain-containing protein [Rhodoglobus sp.]|nr:DUF559 domain-containing protein [Rhodoglobus sp.]